MRLAGKVAIVTGAASGFGEGIARKFVAEGAKVLVVDRDGDGAFRVAEALGADAIGLRADVTDAGDVEAMIHAANDRLMGLDILVNNAGMGHVPQPLESLPEDDFDRILALNVKAIYLAAKQVVPRFKAQKKGVILNIASTAGVSPRPRLTWYNASKGWVITALRRSRLCPQPCRRRDADAEDLHGRGHARDARQVPVDHSDRPLLDARGPGQRRLLPVQRRGVDDHRRGDGGRRRPLHLGLRAGATGAALSGGFAAASASAARRHCRAGSTSSNSPARQA
jgi:hypothetical protein